MASIFTRIINGEIPCYKVAETDKFFAFLDIAPVQVGHTLVIPKAEIDYIFDMPEADYIELQLFARKIALAQKAVIDCKKVATTVVGLEVPHVHIHCVPLTDIPFINFAAERKQLSAEEMQNVANQIAEALAQL